MASLQIGVLLVSTFSCQIRMTDFQLERSQGKAGKEVVRCDSNDKIQNSKTHKTKDPQNQKPTKPKTRKNKTHKTKNPKFTLPTLQLPQLSTQTSYDYKTYLPWVIGAEFANHQNPIDQKLFATPNNTFLHTGAMKLLPRH